MIPLETWCIEIVGYAELISTPGIIERAWLGQDRTATSVVNFDELYVQIFDDLDSDSLERKYIESGVSPRLRAELTAFLDALRSVDTQRAVDPMLSSDATLLQSAVWGKFVETARRLALAARVAEADK